jgi:hypothetical protein
MTKFKVCMSSCRPVGVIMKTANRNFKTSTIMIIATTTSIIVHRGIEYHLISIIATTTSIIVHRGIEYHLIPRVGGVYCIMLLQSFVYLFFHVVV